MHIDQLGFAWFGTYNGLARYDGYSFKNYFQIFGDSTALSGNIIKSIQEDSEGYLWLGTIGGGLCRFDPRIDKFQTYKFNEENSTEGNNVTSII
ncbi:MAG: two-component regulator propeller domain-containing protein, partial [Bacteroidota bacterium]